MTRNKVPDATEMTAARRAAILAISAAHGRRFHEIATRSTHSTGPFIAVEADEAPVEPPGYKPSPRQHEVLSLVANGLSNAEIGVRLQISEETVKSHLHNLFKGMGALNRAHAIAIGFGSGLLDSETLLDRRPRSG
jgi:DNA-binding CsgD family transcriptional regulator